MFLLLMKNLKKCYKLCLIVFLELNSGIKALTQQNFIWYYLVVALDGHIYISYLCFNNFEKKKLIFPFTDWNHSLDKNAKNGVASFIFYGITYFTMKTIHFAEFMCLH